LCESTIAKIGMNCRPAMTQSLMPVTARICLMMMAATMPIAVAQHPGREIGAEQVQCRRVTAPGDRQRDSDAPQV